MDPVDTLACMEMFQGVDRGALRELTVLAPPVRFEKDAIVFQQGDNSDVALLLMSGRLIAEVESGVAIKLVGEIQPGEVAGEVALFAKGMPRSAHVSATEPSMCLLLTDELLSHSGTNKALVAIENQLVTTLCKRIRRTNTAMNQAWADAESMTTDAATSAPSLRGRLNSLFGGGS